MPVLLQEEETKMLDRFFRLSENHTNVRTEVARRE